MRRKREEGLAAIHERRAVFRAQAIETIGSRRELGNRMVGIQSHVVNPAASQVLHGYCAHHVTPVVYVSDGVHGVQLCPDHQHAVAGIAVVHGVISSTTEQQGQETAATDENRLKGHAQTLLADISIKVTTSRLEYRWALNHANGRTRTCDTRLSSRYAFRMNSWQFHRNSRRR